MELCLIMFKLSIYLYPTKIIHYRRNILDSSSNDICFYFRIFWNKYLWKGLIRYSILCIFYCTLSYLIGNNTHTFIGFIKSFIFSSVEYSGLWFISSYFYLYCIAPIINAWHNSLDKYQMRTYYK